MSQGAWGAGASRAQFASTSQAGGHDSEDGKRGGNAANQRHIKTEQKRRDRINDGFLALQQLLPSKEKVEKASMLCQAANYIRSLQGLMQQILDSGSATNLPGDLQFNMRCLLPRKTEQPPAKQAHASYSPYAAAAGPSMRHAAPQGMPAYSAAPMPAQPSVDQMDPGFMNQFAMLPFMLAMMQGQTTGTDAGMPYSAPMAQPSASTSSRDPSFSPHSTLVAPKASMAPASGLQQLVDAASRASEAPKAGSLFKAANKENNPRKRGCELAESIAPPQKQARCYHAGPEVDFASLPDFII